MEHIPVLSKHPALKMTNDVQPASRQFLQVVDLGTIAYGPALRLQECLVAEKQVGRLPDTLLLLEHDPVYTLGRNAKDRNLIASRDFLEKHGISIHRVGRGGDVTYHGPGQLVGYPILNLAEHGLGVVSYVSRLEEVICSVLSGFGIQASTEHRNRGVWVGTDKIAAIGVRVARQVTMHGFSLNIAVNMSHYAGIVPCGIRDRGIASLDRLCWQVEMPQVKSLVAERFVKCFGYGTAQNVAPAGFLNGRIQ